MIAYFDCFSGISGDMCLGALIDLGVETEILKKNISSLGLPGFDISVRTIKKNGIMAKDVIIHSAGDNEERNYTAIKKLIKNSGLSKKVKDLSLNIFEKIAQAESKIHGIEKEKLHFHEVGSVDSIADIVGTAFCIEFLGINKVFASNIPLGSGFVECSHGTIPVPAPATVEILKNIPVYGSDISGEITTPTGAAIIACLAENFGSIPEMKINKIGRGAGKRDIESIPNVLRVITGQNLSESHKIAVVETSIDDMNPEFFGFLMERLFQQGAWDVFFIPVYMKKNRPGTMIQVLCSEDRREQIIKTILSETTSIGVKYYYAQRSVLEREEIEIQTEYGITKAKKIENTDGTISIVPEYEECRNIALQKNIPLKVVYERILKTSYH